MSVLVIAELHDQAISSATLSTITAAKQLGDSIDLVIPSDNCAAFSNTQGVNKIITAEHADFAHPSAESLATLVLTLAENYEYILAPANTFGKNFMPRVAAQLDVAMISDVIEIVSNNTFVRPIYAGNALSTVQSSDNKKLLTIRPTAFAQADLSGETATAETIEWQGTTNTSQFVDQQLSNLDRPELTNAKIVISGGRGLQNAENFHIIEKLADRLGAAVGATRAVVDAGFVPNDYQVGQTGKVVAPDLYIAIGISGAIQHVAGMKDSKVIVAINNDPDAPIFEVADYGLVADFFEILPELEAELEKLGY